AYVRELGRVLGQAPDFVGPGAKPHRMAVLTAGCGLAALLSIGSDWAWSALWLALAVIVILSAATVVRRTLRLAASLRSGWQP
ncbi:MAG TPA: CDP-alcohol phosphatidyltransferase family protein, partial [Brevundimonas sp.]|nr:CDP-alcohol phosphatidyltransferase family protein [Brevundimonas sp.]